MNVLLKRFVRLIKPRRNSLRGIDYWRQRAAQYGKRSVLNINHTEEEYDRVTDTQKQEIFPHFISSLKGSERVVLDLGCGPGRFTHELARLVGGRAIGVDPIDDLLALAPRSNRVEYKPMVEGTIPLADNSMDVVWSSLVLGGLNGDLILRTVEEVWRVLKDGGLLFLVENTSCKPDSAHWAYRSVDQYQALFPLAALAHLHDYFDLDERISILSGRKCV